MTKAIAQFTLTRSDEEYLLTITDDEGERQEYTCDFDQLDLIAEAVDEALDNDEEEMLETDGEADDRD